MEASQGGGAQHKHQATLNKVKKVLGSSSRARVDSQDMTAALCALSSFFVPAPDAPDAPSDTRERTKPSWNTLAARRGLRSELERRAVRTNEEVVDAFGAVEEELLSVEGVVDELAADCQRIAARIAAARAATLPVVERTAELQRERDEARRRLALVSDFLGRFQLSPEDVEALESDRVDDAFFGALDRVSTIRADCRGLLRSYHQRVALDIVDALGKRVEAAFSKLYTWVQERAREMETAASPEVDAVFARAVGRLQERPAYLQHCLQELQQARRVQLIRRFMKALTRGGRGGMPRPIELSAHDPVRYAGDMLAWVHQAAALEREFFASVAAELGEEARGTASRLTARVLEGLTRPLGVRVRQAIQPQSQGPAHQSAQQLHSAAVSVYQVANLLQFYGDTMRQMLPDEKDREAAEEEEPPFFAAIEELRREAEHAVFEALEQQGQRYRDAPPPPTADLAAPRAVADAMAHLDRIMGVYARSLSGRGDAGFGPLLAAVVDPLLEAVAATASTLDDADSCMFRINSITAVMGTLGRYPFTQSRQETLRLELDTLAERLTRAQATAILRKAAMFDRLLLLAAATGRVSVLGNAGEEAAAAAAAAVAAGAPLSRVHGLEEAAVAAAAASFYKTLFGLGAFAVAQCDRVVSTSVRTTVRRGVARLVSVEYAALHAAVHDPASGYSRPSEVMPHAPPAIDTLLEL